MQVEERSPPPIPNPHPATAYEFNRATHGQLKALVLVQENAALRTLDYKGGLDAFIVKARDEKLSTAAQRIKRQVKAKLAEQQAS